MSFTDEITAVSPGAHELLSTILASLEAGSDARGDLCYTTAERGVLRVLLSRGVPRDDDCLLLAEVLAAEPGNGGSRG